jgi:hypothetical protein
MIIVRVQGLEILEDSKLLRKIHMRGDRVVLLNLEMAFHNL